MTISINQINPGMGLQIDGEIYLVMTSTHVKPGKGGAFVRVKVRNIKTQKVLEKTIKPADKIEVVPLEERKLQNLYQSGDSIHFMDNTTYEEIEISKSILGDTIKFLQDDLEVSGLFYNNQVLRVLLPIFITAEVIHTEIGLKGDSSKAGMKPATIDTRATMQVPLFINTGNWIKIDTRTGIYVERVKK